MLGRRRARRRARARAVRGAAGAGGRTRPPRVLDTARRRRRRSTCWPAWPRPPRWATTPSRTCTTATSWRRPTCVIRWSSGSPAAPSCPTTCALDGGAHQLVVLTGPNMGGKSTYLRQVALLSLLAQTGSFVPARDAKLGLVDRIYARVGASDNISRGQSTFMVEMQETAHILSGATSRSLVVLDEVGRGTATFDGLSIAWAVAEHLATSTAGAAQDAVRHALPRADRPGRRRARRGQRARGRAGVEGRHRLPAQDPAGPLRSQLRHPRGAAGRAAAVGGGAGPRHPARARTGRAVARRASGAQRRAGAAPQQQLGLFQAPADDACASGSGRRHRIRRRRSRRCGCWPS